MEKELKKLRSLANEYKAFSEDLNLLDGFHNFRGRENGISPIEEGNEIRIYLTDDGNTWTVYFCIEGNNLEVEIIDFCNEYKIPYDVTAVQLSDLYDDCRNYLNNYLKPKTKEYQGLGKENIKVELKRKREELKGLELKLASYEL